MKKRFYCIAALFLSILSFQSFSEEEEPVERSSGTGTITQFYTNPTGTFLRIKFSEGIINPDACEGTSFYIAELDDSTGSDRFFSTVLAAFMAKKNVSFWVNGCTSRRFWDKTRPRIRDIYVNE